MLRRSERTAKISYSIFAQFSRAPRATSWTFKLFSNCIIMFLSTLESMLNNMHVHGYLANCFFVKSRINRDDLTRRKRNTLSISLSFYSHRISQPRWSFKMLATLKIVHVPRFLMSWFGISVRAIKSSSSLSDITGLRNWYVYPNTPLYL